MTEEAHRVAYSLAGHMVRELGPHMVLTSTKAEFPDPVVTIIPCGTAINDGVTVVSRRVWVTCCFLDGDPRFGWVAHDGERAGLPFDATRVPSLLDDLPAHTPPAAVAKVIARHLAAVTPDVDYRPVR